MKKRLIIGATSAIAEATARLYAKQGDSLYLLARNGERLDFLKQDLLIRGAESVSTGQFVAEEFSQHKALIEGVINDSGGLDMVLVAHGTLPNQNESESSAEQTIQDINVNAVSVISLLTLLANHFEQVGAGSIVVISSVAGDRGRQSNYVYGAAKAMVSTFSQGLRNRLFGAGVNVITIKPGFVDTPMTASFTKGLLWVKADVIARDIIKAEKKRMSIVYTPWFWRYIMLIIRNIPEFVFKRMRL